MTCERCGVREGEIRYTEYVDSEMKRSLICRQCAEELGFSGTRQESGDESTTAVGKLMGVVHVESVLRGQESTAPDTRLCPRCGSTPADLDNNSLFGCPACYRVFEDSLETLFRRVHGQTRHRGRVPGGFVEAPEAGPEAPAAGDPDEGGGSPEGDESRTEDPE